MRKYVIKNYHHYNHHYNYKFKWGKLKARSLIGSSACNLRTRLCDRRLVSWLVNSGIWQRRNSEMSWLFLQCSGSEWFFGWFDDQKKHLAYCWRVLGPIEECGLILWLKVCGVFFPWTKMASYLLSLLLPSPSISYNLLNNARNDPGMYMEQQEETLCK